MRYTIIILLLFLLLLCSPLASASTHFKPVATAEADLNGKIFVNDFATGYSAYWLEDGRLAISSSSHETNKDVRIQWTALTNVAGWSSTSAKVTHKNDAGIIDSERIVQFGTPDAGGFVEFTTDFSTVIIGGYQGSYTISCDGVQDNTTNCSLGQSFAGGNVSAFTGTITPATTETGPYDINTTGLVGWWKLDDDYIDSSGNGNNGTVYGDTQFVNGKYNNGSRFDGDGDYIRVIDSNNFTLADTFTISMIVNGTSGGLLSKSHAFGSYSIEILGDRRINLQLGGWWNEYSTSLVTFNRTNNIVWVFSKPNVTLFVNNELFHDGIRDVSNSNNERDLLIGSVESWNGSDYVPSSFFNGFIDNVLIFDHAVNETERNNLYYDHLQQLRIRTTTNATWSDYYNSTADNPITVNYGMEEVLTGFMFDVPPTAIIDNVTIYDYNKTAQFTPSATVYYGENVTLVTESATAGLYTLNITQNPTNFGAGWMNYTTSNSLLLNADFNNTHTFTTDNTNASVQITLPYVNISTGDINANETKYYNITIDYFYPPTSFNLIDSNTTGLNTSWTGDPRADTYSLYIDGEFVANTTNQYYNFTGLLPNTEYLLGVSLWNVSQQTTNATLIAETDALPRVLGPDDFNYSIVIPYYVANESLRIAPFEVKNISVFTMYPSGNFTYNISYDNSTAYSNNSTGIIRLFSDNPFVLYHNQSGYMVYLESSLSYAINTGESSNSSLITITAINEVISMLGYVLLLAVLLHFGRNAPILHFAAAVFAIWRVFAVFPDDKILGSVWVLILGGALVSLFVGLIESKNKSKK